MQMRNAITRAVAPVTLASALLVLTSALSGSWQPAESAPIKKTCQQKFESCADHCLINNPRPKNGVDQLAPCIKRTCNPQKKDCETAGGNKPPSPAGVQDTGGTGKPPKAANSTSPGGGVATDPKSPPKGAGPRAPVTGGVFSQPSTTGSGGSGPILRSGGGKR